MAGDGKKLKKKICMIGAYGVGKTSLVRKFVHSIFDEKYLSTIGVKIDRKVVEVDGDEVALILWDLAGEEEFLQVPTSYIQGAAGYFLVVDGTRPETLDTALEINERVNREIGSLPLVLLLNKTDLEDEWSLAEDRIQEVQENQGWPILRTSARTGENVEDAFLELTRLIL